jgi:hypothetical protein
MSQSSEVEHPSWSRPAFEAGNTVGMRHGAHSPRVQGERAAAVLAELKDVAPDWLTAADSAQVESYCFALGQVRALQGWLADKPVTRPNGSPWPVEKSLHLWQRRLQESIDRLGFNPISRARGVRDSAVATAVLDAHRDSARGAMAARGIRVLEAAS